MTPEDIVKEPAGEPLKRAQNDVDKQVADLMARVRKLDQNNTNLQKELEKRTSGSKTLEERMAIIEREREEANNRARTVEAFADAGLGEPWRRVFEEADPYRRAEGVRELLKVHESDVAKNLATNLGTAGAPEMRGDGKPQYSMKDLEGMSEADINKAFREGRIEGMK
jgi:hypothetical protein